MGVPKFFRFISERYPSLLQFIHSFEVPDFDNLYLDMNGIIHVCSHPNDADPYFRITEKCIFKAIFSYIEYLFKTIKPKKLFFLAVDGVAPRAKMNQQRGRRFRTAKDLEMSEEAAVKRGETLPDAPKFDTNCITPGTVFMDKLHHQLQYFISMKITTDPLWRKCEKVILSGHDTPGEGEHKIMDYIRYLKTQPDYDPYLRHCLYGLDADLVMLGLSTHCPNFSLLREEVKFGRSSKNKRIATAEETRFLLLHLSMMRDYLALEFQDVKKALSFDYNLENIVDDWILMLFLVGNDFIPHLPNLHINKGALSVLYQVYKEVLPELDGYLQESGYLNLKRFQTYLAKLAKIDMSNFEELVGTAEEEDWDSAPKARSSALQRLIDETDEATFTDESDDEFMQREFGKFKSNYYREKLEYENVDEETLKSQAEGYIRAIQWNLHYYYHGCQSWSWYYPHHYSPYISDLINFNKVDLNFDMGTPFRPFDQLLAVLPPHSKSLVPHSYQQLMTQESSPIIDFYPPDFETDLNGKTQDWEAVVLLPFINENRLLDAVEQANKKLTPGEKQRNTHGPVSVFTYSEESVGQYKSDMFPTFKNHCKMGKINPKDILVAIKNVQPGLHPDYDFNVFIPGFPSFRFVEHTAKLKGGAVKVFEQQSRGDTLVVFVTEESIPNLHELADKFLGQIVYAGWPHLVEARVSSVCNGDHKITIVDGVRKTLNLSGDLKTKWEYAVNNFKHRYAEKLGIKLGEVAATIAVNRSEGNRICIGDSGAVHVQKMWSTSEEDFAWQTVLILQSQIIKIEEPKMASFEDVYPKECRVIVIAQPNYGCVGQVIEAIPAMKLLKMDVTIKSGDDIDANALLTDNIPSYSTANAINRRTGIQAGVISRITGMNFMDVGKKDRINIGLNLKFSKRNQEMPGYTRRDNTTWLYSPKTVELVEEYLEKFPEVFDYLNRCQEMEIKYEDVFGKQNGIERARQLEEWLNTLPCRDCPLVQCGAQMLDPTDIQKLERAIDAAKPSICNLVQTVKIEHVFKPDLTSDNVLPTSAPVKHQLLDRVVCCRASTVVPFGLRGYIIGIHADSTVAQPTYDILWDEAFTKGMALWGSSPERGYRLRASFFINLSAENRTSGPRQVIKSKPNLMNLSEPSAFASFKPEKILRPDSAGKAAPNQDWFKKMWEASAQTPAPNALMQTLKVATQNNSTNSKSSTDHCATLAAHCVKLNMPPPEYKVQPSGNLVMVSVTLNSGQVYWGVPSQDEEDARQNAALQALAGLRIARVNKEVVSEQLAKTVPNPKPHNSKTRTVSELESVLLKGIVKNAAPPANVSHSRPPGQRRNHQAQQVYQPPALRPQIQPLMQNYVPAQPLNSFVSAQRTNAHPQPPVNSYVPMDPSMFNYGQRSNHQQPIPAQRTNQQPIAAQMSNQQPDTAQRTNQQPNPAQMSNQQPTASQRSNQPAQGNQMSALSEMMRKLELYKNVDGGNKLMAGLGGAPAPAHPRTFYNSSYQSRQQQQQQQPGPPMPPTPWRQNPQNDDRTQRGLQGNSVFHPSAPQNHFSNNQQIPAQTHSQPNKASAPLFVPLQAITGKKVSGGVRTTTDSSSKSAQASNPQPPAATASRTLANSAGPEEGAASSASLTQSQSSSKQKTSPRKTRRRNAAKLNWD